MLHINNILQRVNAFFTPKIYKNFEYTIRKKPLARNGIIQKPSIIVTQSMYNFIVSKKRIVYKKNDIIQLLNVSETLKIHKCICIPGIYLLKK